VIHINNGLHGWKYTEEQYRQSLPKLMATLTKYGKGAVIIWATSTPRRNAQIPAQLATDNGRVMERNRIAVEYMNQHGIAVDDLYSLVADHPEYYNLPKDATHFNPQGRALQGKQVSEIILKALVSKSAAGKGQ
jgi:lysophospholipase L1-like esterase